jgi:rRNA maturation endonuclease Nob1
MLFIPMAALTEVAVFFGKRYEKSRPATEIPTKAVNRCKFCSAELETRKPFCDSCGKSQL